MHADLWLCALRASGKKHTVNILIKNFHTRFSSRTAVQDLAFVQGWLGCKGRYGRIHGGPRGLPCRRRRAYARQSHALRALHLLGRGRFAHLDCNARASLDLRRQIVKVRMLERVFGGYPLGGVVLQHLCYQGEAARIELWAEDIEREPRLRVLAPLGLELG